MEPHDQLTDLSDRYWDGVLAATPSQATLLGDHRFDDRLEDFSTEAQQRQLDERRALRAEVEAVDPAGLTAADRVTRGLLLSELSTAVEQLEWRWVELASDQMDGVHADQLMVIAQTSAPEPAHAAALVRRYRGFGAMLDQAAQRFRDGLAAGRTPPRITIERSLHQVDGYLATDLGSDLFANIAGPVGWDGEAAWRAELTEVARESIRPAFQRYRDALANDLLPAARPDDKPGLCHLGADGEDIYRRELRRHTTLPDLGAQEIHQLGLSELEALREEWAVVGKRLFGVTDTAEIFAKLRSDPALRYTGGAEMMQASRAALDKANAEMGNWFGRLPKQSCDILPVPDFLAADAPPAYYFPPASDGSRSGAFFVSMHEPEGKYRYNSAAMAYHEAVPGHHLQLTIANELTGVPRFQRQSFANTAFVEGWALYTERLADEMGLYADDLDLMGMLAADSWRSCRLVVDTGLHAEGWTRKQAIDFIVANVPLGVTELTTEVDRYIGMPGQAVSYKVGQLEIRRLRAQTEARLGAAFDIKVFHDTVVGSGSVSLPVLRELVAAI
ncbi:DUF885 domain-containing protein [Nocardia panacis]|uniref:DUF885 domain-containing protein n=1 Tax=Nocardia panacis TaxID=2340916 RepID=A0A3A4JY37_9NOCA|nr:DUF885 domain-containing protein [Nocardia panacis]RJO69230.1 DUF885 domain-containing protein [Nocardia panacis]